MAQGKVHVVTALSGFVPVMFRRFGAKEELRRKVDNAPSLQEASAKIDLQVQSLEAKILKCDEELKAYVSQATSSAKTRAIQVMKRKKQYESQRDKLIDTQFNVESMAHQQETAEITATTVAALAAGHEKLKEQTGTISLEKVERLTDNIAEVTADLNDITDLLANPLGMAAIGDEDEFAAEYAKLQAEQAADQFLEATLDLPEAVAATEPAKEPMPGVAQATPGASSDAETLTA
uniref:Uncharacterized protein n=1 Tax=Noctiluca scintillans TaxID=2966 RepID=A0A7S1F918_NOCSC